MRIRRIKATNFVCYKNLDVTFPLSGLIGIEGINVDNPVMVSNAVGKTVIFDLITYAIHGEIIRKKRANIIGSFGDEMKLSVWFKNTKTKEPIKLIRRRSKAGGEKVRVRVGAKLYKGTPTKLQPLIDRIFGMGWLTMRNCVVYGDSTEDNFIYSTDKKRKEILSEIADVLFLRKARKIATESKKKSELALSAIESRTNLLKENYLKRKEELAKSIDNYNTIARVVESELNEIGEREKELLSKIEKKTKLVGKAAIILKKVLAAERVEKELRKKVLSHMPTIESNVDACAKKLNITEANLKTAKDRLVKLKCLSECPTCKTSIKKINITPFKEEVNKFEQETHTCSLELERQKLVLYEYKKEEAKLVETAKTRQMLAQEYNDLKLQLAEIETVEKGLEVLSEKRKRSQDKEKVFMIKVETATQDLQRTQQRYGRSIFEKNKAKSECLADAFWIERFGQHGIEADFISDLVTELSGYVSDYIHRLTDGSIGIEISPYRAIGKKLKSEIVIDVTHNGRTKDFRLYSGGQKNRIERAIGLGLMQLASESIQFKLFDEIGRNLPPKGYERVVQLLKEIFEGQQIFLITHNRELQKLFDYRITVKMEGGESKLEINA